MPFYRPNVAKIIERRIGDFEYELGSQSARVKGTVEHALAKSGSGAAHSLHGHLQDVAKNSLPHTADDESLRQQARTFGIYQLEATRATGLTAVATSAGVDTVLPGGTVITRDDGFEYEVLADTVVLGFGGAGVAIRAKVAGTEGNAKGGITLTIQSPVVGIKSDTTLFFDIVDGLAAETTAALRTRLLDRLASPPKGGGPGDYESWAQLVPGVTRAWEFKWAPKVGFVTVLFMRDLDTEPFPDFVAVAAVAAKLAEYAPVVAPPPIVQAPTKLPIALTIELTIEPSFLLSDVQDGIYKAIRDMLVARFEPQSVDGVLYKSWISEAISSVAGEFDHKLTFPVGDYPVPAWNLPVVEDGGISWI